MKPQCIEAVQAAAQKLGRAVLSKAELGAIDDRIAGKMRELARTEEGWSGMSLDQRVNLAAERAMADIAAEAARKVENAQRQILKTAATEGRVKEALELFEGDKRAQALVHDIDKTGEYVQGIKMEAMGNLMGLLDAVKSRDGAGIGRRVSMFLFDAENPHMTADLASEIFANGDGHSGNKVATEGAKAWLKVIEDLRQRFNAAGGDVGKLDYGYLPQPHDSARVRQAGRETWISKIMPALDRSRYVDEAGARLSDAEVTRILQGVWETISTDGINKQEAGAFRGSGARANRGAEARQAALQGRRVVPRLHRHFGRGSMYDAMVAHVGRISRDIGLVERYGPNPNAHDAAAVRSRRAGRRQHASSAPSGIKPQTYWDWSTGRLGAPTSARIAQVGTDIRNIQTAASSPAPCWPA
jgi:hypothetical protein